MTDDRPRSKPAIFQVGTVIETEDTVRVTGWGLGMCAARCMCHRHPGHGALSILEDPEKGHLGLRSYRPQGCDCCEPWTTEELVAITADLSRMHKWTAEERGQG